MKLQNRTYRTVPAPWLCVGLVLLTGATVQAGGPTLRDSIQPRNDKRGVSDRVAGGECITVDDCTPLDACHITTCQGSVCVNTPIPKCVACDSNMPCPPVELVVLMDTSGSLFDEGDALCNGLDGLVTSLAGQGVTVIPHVFSISGTPAFGFTCLEGELVSLYGSTVPGSPGTCAFPNGASPEESWGPAVAIAANSLKWTPGALRLIVPITDEGPCNGSVPEGCGDPGDDRDAIINAIAIANARNVKVSPIIGDGADACATTLGSDLALGTGGTMMSSTVASTDLLVALETLLSGTCNAGGTCNDGNACTTDSCVADVCENPLNYDVTTLCCSPGDGALETIDDQNDCTFDFCNPTKGFVNHFPLQDGTTCDDGDPCTIGACDGNGNCISTPKNCDDGITCTVDSCDGTTGECLHDPNAALCDNSLFCDGVEVCDLQLDCQPGPARDCSDQAGCTVDTCDEQNDVCVHTPDDGVCGNQLFCDGQEICDLQLGCIDGADPDCADTVSCTLDACDETNDTCTHTPDDTLCDNGMFCDGAESCDAMLDCVDGAAPDCNDTVACTVDSCNEDADRCDHTADDSLCDNQLFCDGQETCNAEFGCGDGPDPSCDDGIPCTTDACDETADACTYTPDDTVCDNGLFCDGAEVCDLQLGCAPTDAPDCNDNVSCTVDACDETNDICTHTTDDTLCDDGLFCNGAELCDSRFDCQTGFAPDCDDLNACTSDGCDEANDICVSTPTFDEGVACCAPATGVTTTIDDMNECTVDLCNPLTGLVSHTPTEPGTACDDGDPCTVESCDGQGNCASAPKDCSDGVACTIDTCEAATGVCMHAPDDGFCNDGQFCDGVEFCDAQLDCQTGPVRSCDDGLDCTTDSCDEVNDICVHVADDAVCSNGLFCDGIEVCDLTKGCLDGPDPVCDDQVPCTTNTCNVDLDQCEFILNPAFCDNGLFCDGVEFCHPEFNCLSSVPPDCGDGVGCTVDSCDEENDTCVNAPDDQSCDNGLYCDGAERCDALLDCQPTTPRSCDDAVVCTVDSCDEVNDICVNSPDDQSCANGMYCDGVEVCDPVKGCLDGPDPDCADTITCTVDTCDEVNDVCVHTTDDALCDNQLYCDGVEICDAELDCQDGPDPDCDDGVSCTDDGCDEINDICTHTPNDSLCANGQYCDGDEICDAVLGCQDGPDPDCSDQVTCTIDSCDEVNDICLHVPDAVVCSNGQFCDGEEVCDPKLGCVDGPDPNCDDSITCTGDSCDEVGDQCVHVPDDAVCNDGETCETKGICEVDVGCVCIPSLCLEAVPEGGVYGNGCHLAGDEIVIHVRLGTGTAAISSGQFVIPYDPALLDFIDIVPGNVFDATSPFSLEMFRSIDETTGSIVYAVAVGAGQEPTSGPAIMATVTFIPLQPCTETELCLTSDNPLNTLLSDEFGASAPFNSCCTGVLQLDDGPPVLNCPPSVSVNAAAGQLSTFVTWDPITTIDGCPGEVTIACTAVHSLGFDINGLIVSGGLVPMGVSTFTCTATDSCGASSTCEWVVEVSDLNTLEVALQLSPTMVPGPLLRCIDFEFFSSCLEQPEFVQAALNFGLPFDLPGRAKNVEFKVPAGQYFCVTARDALHTIRSIATPEVVGDVWFVSFKGDPFLGGNWLVGGNLDGSPVIDTLDFGVFFAQEGQVIDPDTSCSQMSRHADINGDGIVDALDLTFIQLNFLLEDKGACCPGATAAASPVVYSDISLEQLDALGLGEYRDADLNGDGRINGDDIAAYMAGARAPVDTTVSPSRSMSPARSERK